MARRPLDGSAMLPGMDGEPRVASRPRGMRGAPPPDHEIPTARIIMIATCAAVILLASMYGLHKLEQFVIRDTRFALNGPEGSWETPTLEIVGATHASQRQLEAMFTEDAGRSVY